MPLASSKYFILQWYKYATRYQVLKVVEPHFAEISYHW